MKLLKFLSLIIVASGLSTSAMAILNGKIADAEIYNGIVIILDPVDNTFCSGTKIADDVILTAAHCNLMHPGAIVSTVTNIHAPPKNLEGRVSKVVRSIDRYGKKSGLLSTGAEDVYLDMALLFLDKPLIGKNIKLKSAPTLLGKKLLAIGYGYDIRPEHIGTSGVRRMTTLHAKKPLFPYDGNWWNPHRNIRSYMIGNVITGSPMRPGDSGGFLGFENDKHELVQFGIFTLISYDDNSYFNNLNHKDLCWIEKEAKVNIEKDWKCKS